MALKLDPPKPQGSYQFLGVNLRRGREQLADEDLARAINADLHSTPGKIVLRLGRQRHDGPYLDANGLLLEIRRLAKINGHRYRIGGKYAFRDATLITSSLNVGAAVTASMPQSGDIPYANETTLLPFRPLNDETTWAFLADVGVMGKDNGTTFLSWGVVAPIVAPIFVAGAAGGLTGEYRVMYTFARLTGDGALAYESNPSPASGAVSLSSQVGNISGIGDSDDPQATHVRIYRTIAGGSVYGFDQSFPIGPGTAITSQADSGLGIAVEFDNDIPEPASWIATWQEFMFFCREPDNPHFLRWSKRYRPESQPALNFIEIGNPDDPLQCAVPMSAQLAVFTPTTKYRVILQQPSPPRFAAFEAMSRRGTRAFNAVIPTEYGIIFPSKDGCWLTNITSQDTELSQDIEPLFMGETRNEFLPINWDAAATMSAATRRQRYYLAYPSGDAVKPDMMAVYSHDTKKWYFFSHPARSLYVEEDIDTILAGGIDGYVYTLEEGVSDALADIEMTVETKDFFGVSPHIRKLMIWFQIDAEIASGTLTAEFMLDGTVKRTVTFTALTTRRQRPILQLPDGCLGYFWRIRLTYEGQGSSTIHGVQAFGMPLEGAP